MARSVESSPLRPTRASTTPESASPASATAIRAVNPSPAPAKRRLRLSTRALTPSQQRSLAYALIKDPEPPSSPPTAEPVNQQHQAATLVSVSLSPVPGTPAMARKKSRRIASEPMLSRLYASRKAQPGGSALPPPDHFASARRRPSFDFQRATALALSSPGQSCSIHRQMASSPAPVAAGRKNQKKTRTPRKDPSGAVGKSHPHSLVKSMLGLAARTVKAFSTTHGRKRFLFGQQQHAANVKRAPAGEAEWVDDELADVVSKAQAQPEVQAKDSPKVLIRKRLRVSDESARSRLAREEQAEAVRSCTSGSLPVCARVCKTVCARMCITI